MTISLCLVIALGIALYLHLRHPPTTFTQRVRVVDQVLLAQFYQLEIPQKDIHKREELQKRREKTWTLTHWTVILPQGVEPKRLTAKLGQIIKEACPGVILTQSKARNETWEMEVKIGGLVAHHLILHPPRLRPPKPRPPWPRIAIVMDDLGLNKKVAEELLCLDIPLTFSVLPLRPFSRSIARLAHDEGREIILHLPMEPRGYPLKDPGEGALFASMGEKELLRLLSEDLGAVPYIKGVSNHMGSRFMEKGEKVRLVLGVLQKKGLFFLDSLTTSKSKGYRIARELNLRTGKRDLFLDNKADVKYTKLQLGRLIRIARTNGKAIGICHPYPTTITALREMVTTFEEQGVEIVPLSQALDY